jgi:ABC-type transporter Mla subunit MlaD
MSAKVGSAANSMHGYLVGYALDQVGGALLDGVESAASDAAVNPERIAQLTDQINQQKAAIAQHQAELNKWVGTTAQVDASQYAAATAIASETRRLPSWSNSCNSYWLPSRPLRTDRYPVCFLWV